MSGKIDTRLGELGLDIPTPAAPAANYVPYVVSGRHVFLAGQITLWNGELRHVGKLGDTIAVKEGQENDPRVKKLAKLLTSPEVKKFIEDTYAGSVLASF